AQLAGKGEAEADFSYSGVRDTTIALKLGKPKPAAGGTGVVTLWMRPAGTIFINRVAKYTDVETVSVVFPAGEEHHVQFVPNWSAHERAANSVRLTAGQSRPLGYDFRDRDMVRLDVTATGGGGRAVVSVDGKPSRVTVPGTIFIGSESHRIDVMEDGWKSSE